MKRISISPYFLIIAAAAILFLPLQWLVAWCIASALHEFFHYIALIICGYGVYGVQVCHKGIIMITDDLRPHHGIICSLAGPLGGFLMLLFVRVMPRTALCGAVLSAYNLLPIGSLDGGRALYSFLTLLLNETKAQTFMRYIEYAVLCVVYVVCIYAAIKLHTGLLPIMAAVLLTVRCKKTTCNEAAKAVQYT